MSAHWNDLRRAWCEPARDPSGATSVEYAIMASAMAVVIVLSVAALGISVSGLFGGAADGLNGVASEPDGEPATPPPTQPGNPGAGNPGAGNPGGGNPGGGNPGGGNPGAGGPGRGGG